MPMLPRLALAGLLISTLALSAHAEQRTYTLDSGHTDVIVAWDHFGLAQPSAMFNHITGTLVFDPAHPTQASVSASIPVSSIHTASDALNGHLQASDFLDAAKYPNITFKSTAVKAGATDKQLLVTGDLSLHGVTKPVTLDVTINKIGERHGKPAVAFNAKTTIQRSEFGVNKYVPMVSDALQVTLTTGAVASDPVAKAKAK
ncbi:MAG: YceI family protein [Xanthomonadales bacterium]|nr:YceI family protein [Xanthomonadales bacterium]